MAKVWVDDAAAELLPEAPTKIMNGDFEQKALQYWDWDGEPDSVRVMKDFAKGSYIGESQGTSSQTSGDCI